MCTLVMSSGGIISHMIGIRSKGIQDSSLILNLPNAITALRILLSAAIISLMLMGIDSGAVPVVGILFLLAWFSDWLDGYFARKLGQTSLGGSLLDLIADRLLSTPILILTIVLGFWQRISGMVPLDIWPYAVVVIGADLLCAVGIISFMRKRISHNFRFPAPPLMAKIAFCIQMTTLSIVILNLGPDWLLIVLMYLSIVLTLLAFRFYFKKGGYVLSG
jgi:phosphatidylglycerophosphate synthase